MNLNWPAGHPDDLIERTTPAQALHWLRQQPSIDDAAAGKLDLFLHHWVLRVLCTASDKQELLEVMSLCQVGRVRAPGMAQRWQAFEDLLEGKRRSQNA
jgi:hypothetical protein